MSAPIKRCRKVDAVCRVHIGGTGDGHARYLYFPTMDDGNRFANAVLERAGLVLSVVRIEGAS